MRHHISHSNRIIDLIVSIASVLHPVLHLVSQAVDTLLKTFGRFTIYDLRFTIARATMKLPWSVVVVAMLKRGKSGENPALCRSGVDTLLDF